MKTAAEDKAYVAADLTANKGVPFQICLSYAETQDTSWYLADTERLTKQVEREIYNITSNDQMRFKTEYCICLIEFEAWRDTFGR
jgi:hypothetical protein